VKRLLSILCVVAVVLAWTGASTPAQAFNSRAWLSPGVSDDLFNPHDLITRSPLEAAGYRCEAVQAVIDGNLSVDGPGLVDELVYHFNRTPIGTSASPDALTAASTGLLNQTAALLRSQMDKIVYGAEATPGSALRYLGEALHTIQDFYSHSNWYEMDATDLLLAEMSFLHDMGDYTGRGVLLAAYDHVAGACQTDAYAHGPLCPLGGYPRPCSYNNDCITALQYGPSRDHANEATRFFLQRVRNQILSHTYATKSAAEVYQGLLEYGCEEPEHEPSDEDDFPGDIVTSVDPNEILGPLGGGAQRACSPDQPWVYEIHFENLASAGAAANTVDVYNPIDPVLFDIASTHASAVFVGSRSILLDQPAAAVDTLVDLRPGRPCLLHITSRISSTADSLVWRFASIDPATGAPPEDPDGGFLPPNTTSPMGEGGLTYSIRPRAGVADGTVIGNEANIVFDAQASIATGRWTNRTDRTPPTLVSLVADSGSDSTLTLHWQGADQTSGVRDCDIYVLSADGRPRLAAAGVVADSAIIGIGPATRTGFIAVVRDSAGNVRTLPASADAFGETGGTAPAEPGVSALLTYPSPARAEFTAAFRLGARADVDLVLHDVAGRRVWEQHAAGLEPGLHAMRIATGSSVRPGVYWLRVSTPQGRLQNRVVLLK
jgi:hypothetical protein